MMFLQFFIWGVWYVPMWNFIGGIEIAQSWKEMKLLDPVGLAYASTGLAAMISPFIVGMVADRFFPTQIVFGVLHLLGALLYLHGLSGYHLRCLLSLPSPSFSLLHADPCLG